MDVDVNRVVQKLTAQLAAQSQQIAVLQVQVEQLQAENDELKKEQPIDMEPNEDKKK